MAVPTVTIEVGYGLARRAGSLLNPVGALTFPANPDIDNTVDLRTTLIQTRVGAYYDKFGIGIPTLVLSGTTAWLSAQARWNGRWVSGKEAALHLARDIVGWYEAQAKASQTPSGVEMQVVDEAGGNLWTVEPITNVQFSQTQAAPIQIFFTLNLSVILDHMTGIPGPPPPDWLAQHIGNRGIRQPHAEKHLATHAKQAQHQRQHPYMTRTILSGETFWSIAQSVLGQNATEQQVMAEVHAIEHANPALNPNSLLPGIRVRIPLP